MSETQRDEVTRAEFEELQRKVTQTLSAAEECRDMLAQLMGFVTEFQGMAQQMTAQGGPMGMIARAFVPEEEHAERPPSKLPRLFG